MKVNEAPEKIYLQENTTTDCYGEFWPEWFEARGKDTDIEYTRTDAFIEKAKKYLEERFINEVSIIAGGPVVIHFNQAFDNFIKYMKGE